MRMVWRKFIIFLHTIIIYIPVAIVFKVEPNLAMLLAIPGLILVFVNLIWLTTVVAILSTRYRDIQPISAPPSSSACSQPRSCGRSARSATPGSLPNSIRLIT